MVYQIMPLFDVEHLRNDTK